MDGVGKLMSFKRMKLTGLTNLAISKMQLCCIFMLLTLFLASCGGLPDGDNIVGKWRGQNDEDGLMIFLKDGQFDVLDNNENSVFNDGQKSIITWEIITEVEPHQLYFYGVDWR